MMGTLTENDTPSSIHQLCTEIGTAGAARVLAFALPRIQELDRDLQALLLAGDRCAAAKYAHRGLSSVRAYGTAQLEELLRQVNDESSDLQALRTDLAAEFGTVVNSVENWLCQHGTMRHD